MGEIDLNDRDALRDALEKFFGEENVETVSGWLKCDCGNAHFEIGPDNRVKARMPLHDIDKFGVESLEIDSEHEEIRIRSDGLEYTFRKP